MIDRIYIFRNFWKYIVEIFYKVIDIFRRRTCNNLIEIKRILELFKKIYYFSSEKKKNYK